MFCECKFIQNISMEKTDNIIVCYMYFMSLCLITSLFFHSYPCWPAEMWSIIHRTFKYFKYSTSNHQSHYFLVIILDSSNCMPIEHKQGWQIRSATGKAALTWTWMDSVKISTNVRFLLHVYFDYLRKTIEHRGHFIHSFISFRRTMSLKRLLLGDDGRWWAVSPHKFFFSLYSAIKWGRKEICLL